MCAATNGFEECINMLIKGGADVSQSCRPMDERRPNCTPLMETAMNGPLRYTV